MISKTESGRVSKEIPGSGSGSGTRWALLKCIAGNLIKLSTMFNSIPLMCNLGVVVKKPGRT